MLPFFSLVIFYKQKEIKCNDFFFNFKVSTIVNNEMKSVFHCLDIL